MVILSLRVKSVATLISYVLPVSTMGHAALFSNSNTWQNIC